MNPNQLFAEWPPRKCQAEHHSAGLRLRSLNYAILSPIMENQMNKKMENDMDAVGISGVKELNLSYHYEYI